MLRRRQLFEFCDQTWLPGWLREAELDCLSFIHDFYQPYYHLVRPLAEWAERAGVKEALDFASGSAEQIGAILKWGVEQGVDLPAFVASDLYPNLEDWRAIQAKLGPQKFKYIERPLSALDVQTTNLRHWSIFTAFHHFTPADAKKFLQQFTEKGDALCIMEITQRNLFYMLIIFLSLPLFLLTPFFAKKFKWSKFIVTAIIPLVPLMITFDGVVSALRSYTKEEIVALLPPGTREQFDIDYRKVWWRFSPFKATMFSLIRKK